MKGRVNDNHSPICRKRRTSFYYIRSLCRKTSWCVTSPFYKSHESSIRFFSLSLSYMRMYIYIYISLSSHSRINKLTHAIFLSLSLFIIIRCALCTIGSKGGINGFLFEYLSRWKSLWKFPSIWNRSWNSSRERRSKGFSFHRY